DRILDLGDDEFTVGRPHPMIDPRLRNEHIVGVAAEADVAVLLLDVVLGYGSHPDPAEALAPAIADAMALAIASGRHPPVVALEWRPPAAGDRELGLLLAWLEDDPGDRVGGAIAAANARAVDRILAAQPALVDVRLATEAIDGLAGRMLLHSGPPIDWDA